MVGKCNDDHRDPILTGPSAGAEAPAEGRSAPATSSQIDRLRGAFHNTAMTAVRLGGSLVLLISALTGLVVTAERTPPAVSARVDFTRQIRPLLSDRCFRCHGPDASKRKAKLRLDVREGAFRKMDAGWAIVKPFDPGEERAGPAHLHRRHRRHDAAAGVEPRR